MLKTLQERRILFFEFFGLAMELFKQKFKTLTLITLLFAIPFSFISAFIDEKSMSIIDILSSNMMSGSTPNIQALSQLWLYILIIVILSILILPIGSVATAIVAKKALYDEEISSGKALLLAFEKGPSIIFAGLVYAICIGFGSLFIILGIYLSVIWFFYYIVIAVEDLPAIESLTQSKNIVKGQWWSIYGIVIFTSLFTWVASFVVMSALSIVGEAFIIDVFRYILLYFVATYVTLLIALIYMNRKFMMEKENI